MEVYGFNYVVCAVDVLVTNDLNNRLTSLVFFDHNGGNILVDVLCQYGLNNHEPLVALACFYHAEVVNLSVAVEVEVVDAAVVVVERTLELLEVGRLAEYSRYGFQVEVLTDVLALCANGDGFFRPNTCACCQHGG